MKRHLLLLSFSLLLLTKGLCQWTQADVKLTFADDIVTEVQERFIEGKSQFIDFLNQYKVPESIKPLEIKIIYEEYRANGTLLLKKGRVNVTHKYIEPMKKTSTGIDMEIQYRLFAAILEFKKGAAKNYRYENGKKYWNYTYDRNYTEEFTGNIIMVKENGDKIKFHEDTEYDRNSGGYKFMILLFADITIGKKTVELTADNMFQITSQLFFRIKNPISSEASENMFIKFFNL